MRLPNIANDNNKNIRGLTADIFSFFSTSQFFALFFYIFGVMAPCHLNRKKKGGAKKGGGGYCRLAVTKP
jgi:hypothetical protein